MRNLLKCKYFSYLLLSLLLFSCGAELNVNNDDANSANIIVVWGHSAGVIIEPYLKEYLANQIDDSFQFEPCSVDGETMLHIAARQGSLPAYFYMDDCTFIKEENKYRVSTKQAPLKSIFDDSTISPWISKSRGFNPCVINNVKGVLSSRDREYYFVPEGREALPLYNRNEILTYGSTAFRNAFMTFFWCDQSADRLNEEEVVNKYKIMTEYVGNDSFLILGAITGNNDTRNSLENKLSSVFDNHYFNCRKCLLQEASKLINDNTSDEDIQKIQLGQLPSFFMKDNLHLNDKAAKLLAQKIVGFVMESSFISR